MLKTAIEVVGLLPVFICGVSTTIGDGPRRLWNLRHACMHRRSCQHGSRAASGVTVKPVAVRHQ